MELSPMRRRRQVSTAPLPIELHPPLRPSLLFTERSGSERLNWSFLYKQRRRLEDNWAKGRYTNFQLPHPLYPQEAHKECVYTLQFFGKWLVSCNFKPVGRQTDRQKARIRWRRGETSEAYDRDPDGNPIMNSAYDVPMFRETGLGVAVNPSGMTMPDGSARRPTWRAL